jgi:hypothetical protein
MIRLATTLSSGALVAALGTAPMQCAGSHAEKSAREESPGDAIYALSQDFHAKGNEDAAKQTLRFLVEKYPSNRHVPAARAELEGAPEQRTDAGK